MTKAVVAAVLLVSSAAPAGAQMPASAARFDVVSIKPIDGSRGPLRREWLPGRFTAHGVPLILLIGAAYPGERLDGGPDWIRYPASGWTIDATFEPGHLATAEEQQAMLRALLAERFHLVLRREQRQTDVYALDFARADHQLGPSLQASELSCDDAGRMPRGFLNLDVPAPGKRPSCMDVTSPQKNVWLSGNTPFRFIASSLEHLVRKPVVNRTGLDGNFDLVLRYDTAEVLPDGVKVQERSDPGAPSLFTALREQLGLRLEATRLPMDYTVIERVDRATEN